MILAILSALFSLFLDKCFKKDMILRWYYVIIMKHLYYSGVYWKYYLSKPLGTCIYCFSSWVFIAFYLVSLSGFPSMVEIFIGLFLGLGVNYVTIRIYEKIVGEN